MFPDSKIAKDMGLGADKVKYVINFGIGPVFKNALTERIKKSKYYVFSFVILIHTFLVIQHIQIYSENTTRL